MRTPSTTTFAAKKSLGQNFLTNPKIAEKIAKTAVSKRGETVFEVGPGTGALTRALLKEGARIVALEADLRAVEVLREECADAITEGQLTLIHGDIRTTHIEDLPLPQGYVVAANIPYYLSGMLFRYFLESPHQPKKLVFLVQKEVAERIARSKKESLLSLSIKAYGTPRYVGTVSAGNFSPKPKVDSAILEVSSITKDSFKNVSETDFFLILKAGFSSRRKLLMGNLSKILPRSRVEMAFEHEGIPPKARGEDIPIEMWLRLAEALELSPRDEKS